MELFVKADLNYHLILGSFPPTFQFEDFQIYKEVETVQ